MPRSSSPALGQEFKVIFHNPDPEFYVEGSGLVRLDEARFVAVVPVAPREKWSQERRATQSVINILRSEDGGETWQQLSKLPYYSAVPWTYQGKLYLFAFKGGTEHRNDDLLLLSSTDEGATWSDPVTLFTGHYWNCHTSIVIRNDRLYWAIDNLDIWLKRGPRALVGDLANGPMDPNSWQLSNWVQFPGIADDLVNPRFAHNTSQYLEPHMIEVGGRLRVLATVKPKRQTTTNLCAVFDLSEESGQPELTFVQYHPMPGGQLKFGCVWDDVSKMFWTVANLPVDGQGLFDWWQAGRERGNYKCAEICGGDDRRFLMLFYGLDGLNWFQAGCVAQAAKISQSFMYPQVVIDGDDLAIIARTSINAPNQHDADHATFHRVKGFRGLALNLIPTPED